MRKVVCASLLVFASFVEEGRAANQLFNSMNNLIAGATNSGNQTLGGIGNLATNAGSATQNLLNALQKTRTQIHSVNQQVKAGKEAVRGITTKKKMEKTAVSEDLKKQKKALEEQKARIVVQNAQRMNALKVQLQQEEARQKAQMQAINQQISIVQNEINKAQEKEQKQWQADQILARLRLEQMAKQNVMPQMSKSNVGKRTVIWR